MDMHKDSGCGAVVQAAWYSGAGCGGVPLHPTHCTPTGAHHLALHLMQCYSKGSANWGAVSGLQGAVVRDAVVQSAGCSEQAAMGQRVP